MIFKTVHFNLIFFILFIYVVTKISAFNELSIKQSILLEDTQVMDPNDLVIQNQASESRFHNKVNPHEISRTEDRKYKHHYHSHCKTDPFEAFSRRLIKMILKNSKFRIKDDYDVKVGQLYLEATIEDIEVLNAFANGTESILIREVDDVLKNFFQPIPTSILENAAEMILVNIYQHRVPFVAFLIVVFVSIMLLKWTRFRVIMLLIDLMVLISFILTWKELILESEIKLAAKQKIYESVPDECRMQELGFFKSILLFFNYGKGDCIQFYESRMADPFMSITPLQAFSHMLTKFLLHPLSTAGTYLSDFIANFTRILPFPLNYVAMLMLMLVMPISFAILLFTYIGGSAGFKIGPLIDFHLKGRDSEVNLRQAIEILDSSTKTNNKEIKVILNEYKQDLKEICTCKKVDAALDPIEEISSTTNINDLSKNNDLVMHKKDSSKNNENNDNNESCEQETQMETSKVESLSNSQLCQVNEVKFY